MNESINILCATDFNYVPYCGVMLSSVFESNRNSLVNAYILTDKPFPDSVCKHFDKLAKKYGNSVKYLQIDNSFLEKFPIKGMDYWSIATYYRLYAAELLPQEVHRILYLDCDIVVQGNLWPLWELDMTGKAAAGVSDIFEYCSEFYERLLYPVEAGYFNAGALLINVDYWREYAIGQQCLDFLSKHYEIIEANDQDVLNAVLWNKKMSLPLTYNYQIQFKKNNFYQNYSEEMRREIDMTSEPVVIHYAAPQKPWNIMYYQMPFKQIWWHYKRKSPWWYLLPKLPKHKTINYLIKRFLLWPLGIMWKAEYPFKNIIQDMIPNK